MKDITFNSSKGEVLLTEHHGAGNGYHLYVAKFYQGQFVVRGGEWVWLNANTKLTDKEIGIILKKLPATQIYHLQQHLTRHLF